MSDHVPPQEGDIMTIELQNPFGSWHKCVGLWYFDIRMGEASFMMLEEDPPLSLGFNGYVHVISKLGNRFTDPDLAKQYGLLDT
mgnify:CR=1 FL=1